MVTATERERSWLAAEPAVERVHLDEASWVDVVRGFVPGPMRTPCTTSWWHGPMGAGSGVPLRTLGRHPRLAGRQSGSGRHPALVEVEHWISRRYRVRFDGVALAQYRSERDGVGFHRDRELRWLEDTVIGAFTLGAGRPWLVKPLTGRRGDPEDEQAGAIDLSPGSGDLLVMGGRCQAAWFHSVPKMRHRVHSRVSAQWRWTSRRGERDRNPSFFAPRHFSRPG